jgi:transient receptor potential cation channel subfamily A protein 1
MINRNATLWTPLDCAAARGWVEVATILLQEDCPVDPTDKAKVLQITSTLVLIT